MKVSVIIPCYNQALFLPKAIASLQAQTLEDWECIIVDDGSTDNTAEVASNLALQDSRIRLLQKINGGSASARDLGLKHALRVCPIFRRRRLVGAGETGAASSTHGRREPGYQLYSVLLGR